MLLKAQTSDAVRDLQDTVQRIGLILGIFLIVIILLLALLCFYVQITYYDVKSAKHLKKKDGIGSD